MTDTQVDLAALPELRGAREVGTTADGEALLLSLETVGGAVEHFAIHHGRVAALVASLLFASGVAAKARGAAASGGAPSAERPG